MFVSNLFKFCSKYIPLPSTALWLSKHPKEPDVHTLSDAAPKTQAIFQQVLDDTGLGSESYQLKIGDPALLGDIPAVACNHSILLNSEYEKSLFSQEDESSKMLTETIIKHELSHLKNHDIITAKLIPLAVANTTSYSIHKLASKLIARTKVGSLLSAAGFAASWFTQDCLFPKTARNIWERVRVIQENRADDFAIQHARSSEELIQAAKFHVKVFESQVGWTFDELDGSHSQEFSNEDERRLRSGSITDLRKFINLGLLPRIDTSILTTFLFAQRAKDAPAYITHPHPLDRAMKFAEAAQKMAESSAATTEPTPHTLPDSTDASTPLAEPPQAEKATRSSRDPS